MNEPVMNLAAQAAKDAEQETGLPRQLTFAQFILESGWGTHTPGNNCFGIKDYPGCYGEQELMTTEVSGGVARRVPQWFATFPSLTECFVRHAHLITESPRYSMSWENYKAKPDVDKLIAGIAPIYATDPSYAEKLYRILDMPMVKKWLA